MIINAIENTVMKHSINYSEAWKENPCLLVLDNHGSHVKLHAVFLAKSNAVHLLSSSPLCCATFRHICIRTVQSKLQCCISCLDDYQACQYINKSSSTWQSNTKTEYSIRISKSRNSSIGCWHVEDADFPWFHALQAKKILKLLSENFTHIEQIPGMPKH